MAKDIILDNKNDLLIQNGDFVLGKSLKQEVGIILNLSPGNLKSSPLLGPSILRKKRANKGRMSIIRAIKIAFKMDGKNYDELKEQINLN